MARPSKTAREEAQALYDRGLRFCTMCREELPISMFAPYKNGLFGIRSNCQPCMNLRSQKTYHNNKDLSARAAKRKAWKERNTTWAWRLELFRSNIRTKYGLTLEGWEFMLRDQTGRCEICSEPMVRPHIDHCHTTNVVRGLLCDHCNRGLGGFRDNPDYITSSLEYLSRSSPVTAIPEELAAVGKGKCIC